MSKSDVEKCVLSDKMLAYVLGINGAADGGGWLSNSTINPSVAHSILAYNTNNHRAGVDNYVSVQLPVDTSVKEIVEEMKPENPIIVASRGRNPDNPNDRRGGIPLEQRLEINEDNICNNLTTLTKDNMILEEPTENRQLIRSNGGNFAGMVYDDNGISPNLRTMCGGQQQPMVTNNYRIRKLTPRECWRLMAFTDEEFDRAAQVNSNSQLYKQAGNSIVVDVLSALFQEIINADGTVNTHSGEQIDIFSMIGE